jgi:hypothetical protein
MNRRCSQRCCTSLLYAACRRLVPRSEPAAELGALGGTRTPSLLIRRSRHIVQDRPLLSVRWAYIPELSTRDRRCPAAWQQYWQQSRPKGSDPRSSAFHRRAYAKLQWIVRVFCTVANRCY